METAAEFLVRRMVISAITLLLAEMGVHRPCQQQQSLSENTVVNRATWKKMSQAILHFINNAKTYYQIPHYSLQQILWGNALQSIKYFRAQYTYHPWLCNLPPMLWWEHEVGCLMLWNKQNKMQQQQAQWLMVRAGHWMLGTLPASPSLEWPTVDIQSRSWVHKQSTHCSSAWWSSW